MEACAPGCILYRAFGGPRQPRNTPGRGCSGTGGGHVSWSLGRRHLLISKTGAPHPRILPSKLFVFSIHPHSLVLLLLVSLLILFSLKHLRCLTVGAVGTAPA